MAAVKPLLITRNVCRDFGGLKAVDMVDFQIAPNEVRAIIGPNGAGKTTFVSLICGRIEPSAGVIGFDGKDITHTPAHQRVRLGIAYTFQITSVFANLTAYENVALPAQRVHTDGRSKKAINHSIQEALGQVGLADRAQTPAGQLAYGHQRLLEVAMGLALKPRLLILDEPTQGLSDAEIKNFIKLMRDIRKETTILLIEHNMDVVMKLADRITVMEAGKILAEGSPRAIRGNKRVQDAYLGAAPEHAHE